MVGAIIASAAAAIIVIVLLNQAIVPSPRQTERVPATQQGPAFVSLPALPQMPETLTLAPTLDDQPLFLPSLPIFPSLGDVINVSNPSGDTTNDVPTTQESL
jgi:hypothetical protein